MTPEQAAKEKYPPTFESMGIRYDDAFYESKREAFIAGWQANASHPCLQKLSGKLHELKKVRKNAISPNTLVGEYTGDEIARVITYVLTVKPEDAAFFGIDSDSCIMSIADISEESPKEQPAGEVKGDDEFNYPTYEQCGGAKGWDEMTELERVYYDLSKAKSVIDVQKNTIKRLREAAPKGDDVKSKEEILFSNLDKHKHEYMTGIPLVYSKAIYEAMEEYANQFKAANGFSLDDMLFLGKVMFFAGHNKILVNEDTFNKQITEHFKEKFSIDLT